MQYLSPHRNEYLEENTPCLLTCVCPCECPCVCLVVWQLEEHNHDNPSREELYTLAILYFLAYENIRDAFVLMTCFKKVGMTAWP